MKNQKKPLKKKILVVDDEPHIGNLIKLTLSERYDVTEAYTGAEALEKLRRYKPDLILLDIMMSGMDGFQVLEQIKLKKELADVPVVFLTAKSQLQDKMKAIELGANDYITKPFDPLELENKIEANIVLNKLAK
ncbi:MAG: response regulator [Candidatus Woesearchaeota archaeon]